MKTIADAIEEYRTMPASAKSLIRRLLDKIIGLRCLHCGQDVPITIESDPTPPTQTHHET